jgi:hypothetical protein
MVERVLLDSPPKHFVESILYFNELIADLSASADFCSDMATVFSRHMNKHEETEFKEPDTLKIA